MWRGLWLVLATVISIPALAAQNLAPREAVSVAFEGKKVTIEYGRPSLGDRTFEQLIEQLPEDRMWRAGADMITTLTAESDILLGGEKVPAGTYSLYVHCPQDGNYQLVVNKDLGQPLGEIWDQAPASLADKPWPRQSYSQEIGDEEVARALMSAVESKERPDLFTIKMQTEGESAVVTLAWGDRAWSVTLAAAP